MVAVGVVEVAVVQVVEVAVVDDAGAATFWAVLVGMSLVTVHDD